jgi:hypothetical protein
MHRLIALVAAGILTVGTVTTSAAAASTDPAQDPSVLCEDSDNEIDVNFTSGTASVKTTVYNTCLSPTVPAIVIGRVRPQPGTATGAPTSVAINIPHWGIDWYDASNNKVAESHMPMNFSYTGPLPNAMISLALAGTGVTVAAGTGTRVCPTSHQCTYFNLNMAAML